MHKSTILQLPLLLVFYSCFVFYHIDEFEIKLEIKVHAGSILHMTSKCLKCGKEFDEKSVEDPAALKYPSCSDCWKEWTTYAVMVMNEMRLDMSLPEHRKALRKYEKIFFGLEKSEGELQKNPDKQP